MCSSSVTSRRGSPDQWCLLATGEVFAAIHEVAYPGVRATRRLVSQPFHLEGHGGGCGHQDEGLPERKGDCAAGTGSGTDSGSRPQIQPHTHGPSGPPALICSWVLLHFHSCGQVITSDRGAQFISAIWNSLCSKLRVKHSTTMAYQPQSNGLVEMVVVVRFFISIFIRYFTILHSTISILHLSGVNYGIFENFYFKWRWPTGS